MAKAAALVITGLSIALLVIYGADAAAGAGNPDHQGFLDMDHMTRGLGLGGPAMVLPLIAYFISRNDSSKGLGGMILITGILIIIGAVTVIGMADLSEADETARNPFMENSSVTNSWWNSNRSWYTKDKKILDMSVCEKCKNKVPKVYNCEHTNDQDYCSDCYTELHYYLTE